MSNKDNSKQSRFEMLLLKIKPKYYVLVSGILTTLLAFLGFSFLEMLGTGRYLILYADSVNSAMPIIQNMIDSIRQGDTIWYSFSPLLGENMSYVLMFIGWSPFNILYLLLGFMNPETVNQIVLILKMAAAAMAFTFFARKVTKTEGPESIFFSLCYAFGGYAVCNITNSIFIDSMAIFPFVLSFAVETFVKRKNYYRIVLSYALLFITNFYLGYSVGIFTLVFVLAYMIFVMKEEPLKVRAVLLLKWAGCVCVAILISGLFLLPGILRFFSSNYVDGTAYTNRGVTVFNILNTLFWGTYEDMWVNNGMLYSGLPVMILSVLFFVSRRISKKDKLFWGAVTGTFLVAMSITPLYFVLCAFDINDGFNYRFGFVMSLAFCTMAMKASEKIKETSIKTILIIVSGITVFYPLMMGVQALQDKGFANSLAKFGVNFGIMMIWVGLFLLVRKAQMSGVAVYSLAILLIFAELISNSFTILPQYREKRDYYLSYYDNISDNVDYVSQNDDSFYRLIVVGDEYDNSELLFDYNGVGIFASCMQQNAAYVLNELGFTYCPRVLETGGYTPATKMLLGVKYLICPSVNFAGYSKADPSEIRQNDMYLNVGYMVEDTVKDLEFEGKNVFANNNSLLESMTGKESKVFVETNEYEIVQNGASIEKTEEGYLLTKINSQGGIIEFSLPEKEEYEDAYVQFETNRVIRYDEDQFYVSGGENIYKTGYKLYSSQAEQMYHNEQENKYMLTLKASQEASQEDIADLHVVYYSENALEEMYSDLSEEQFIVEEWKDGYLKGHIDVTSDRRVLMFSIPYENGWDISVNGQKVEPFAVVEDAFMAIELPGTGNYNIEMKFKCPGVKAGTVITLTGLLITLIMFLTEKRRKAKADK